MQSSRFSVVVPIMAVLSPLAAAEAPDLERAIGSVALSAADMARELPEEVRAAAVVVRVSKDGAFEIVDPAGEELLASTRSLDEVRGGLARALALPREGIEALRDPSNLSHLHVLIAADRGVQWVRVAHLMFACGTREVMASNLWLLADAGGDGAAGLPVFLPRDVGVTPGSGPAAELVRVAVDRRSAGWASKDALYPWAYRTWKEAEGRPVRLNVHSEPEQPFGDVVAVVNEARRFGFGVTFRGAEPASLGRTADGSSFVLPPRDQTVEVPPLRPGIALAGDPLDNPHMSFGLIEEEEEDE